MVDYPNSKKARKVFLCLMVGSGRYAGSKLQGSSDSMMVDQEDTLPQGIDGDEDPNAKSSVPFERRRQREKHKDKGRKSKVDKTWILKKKEV